MDTRVRLLANVVGYGGEVVMLTATAPGYDQLPKGDRRAAREWNQGARLMWTEAHHRARQWTIRHTGITPDVLAWAWEEQERATLHKHVILGLRTPAKRYAAHVYALALEREWKARGGGFVDVGNTRHWRAGRFKGMQAEHAARYLAKYLVPLTDTGKASVVESAKRGDAPPLIVWVAPLLTRRTGITMRYLRYRRYVWKLGHTLDAVTGEVTPRTPLPGPRERILTPGPRGP